MKFLFKSESLLMNADREPCVCVSKYTVYQAFISEKLSQENKIHTSILIIII